MRKIKKLAAMALVLAVMVSTVSVSVSAASDDRYVTLKFYKHSGGLASTGSYTKANATPVYIQVKDQSLPYQGFRAGTSYYLSAAGGWVAASSGMYRINDYREYFIRANATSTSMKGKSVRITGEYKNSTYDNGDVTFAWSEDSVNTGGIVYLN